MCQLTFAAATADNLSYRFTCCKGRKLAQIKKREIPLNWTTECSRFESVCFFRCFFSVQSLPALPIDIWARCAAVQLKTTSFLFFEFPNSGSFAFFLFFSKLLSLGKEERKKSSHFGFGFLLKKKTAAVNEVCLLQNEQTNSEREKKKTENSERCLFVLQQRQWQFKIKDRFFCFYCCCWNLDVHDNEKNNVSSIFQCYFTMFHYRHQCRHHLNFRRNNIVPIVNIGKSGENKC